MASASSYYMLRKAMLWWDIGHYGYEFLFWLSTFVAFFLSAIWEESLRLQNGEVDEQTQEVVGRRLAESAEYAAAEEVIEDMQAMDDFTPGEMNTYSGMLIAIIFTLLIKYVLFPWLFVSFLPRLKNLSPEAFGILSLCVLKSFGKVVKLCTEFALPLLMLTATGETVETGKTTAVTSIGEYFGDFVVGPWLFVVYILPLLKCVLNPAAAKRSTEP